MELIMTMPAWDTMQWLAFGGSTTAGCAAIALFALAIQSVRSWRTPATHYAAAAPRALPTRPRPSIEAAARRAILPPAPISPRPLSIPVIDPTGEVLEHMAPGPGSLTSLAQTGPGAYGPRIELVDADVAQWFRDALDRPAHVPSRSEALELDEGGALTRFHAALEPSMRTAHLWLIQGRGHEGHDSARQALDRWRINTPTGEYALVPA